MAGKTGTPDAPAAEPAAELRGTLIKRMAVAGGLVAVLLGVLAFFDYLASPDEPEAPVYTEPVPVPPKKEFTQPVKTAESLPEPPPQQAVGEKPAAPAVEAAPKAEPSAAPARAEPQASAPAKASAKAAPVTAPTPAQPVPAHPAPAPRTEPVAAVPEATAAPEVKLPQEPTAKLAPPAPTRLVTGYIVKAGIFTSVQKAEELHAKLTLNGIPSTLEARVQVGPFKNKAEAAAAKAKLKALGVEGAVIPPAKGRH